MNNNRKPFLALAVLAALSTASAFAATPPAAGDAPRPAKLDTNGDGVIDRSEAAADPRLAAKFDSLDTNKDGKLSRSEMVEGALRRFDELDKNKDGQVTPDERPSQD